MFCLVIFLSLIDFAWSRGSSHSGNHNSSSSGGSGGTIGTIIGLVLFFGVGTLLIIRWYWIYRMNHDAQVAIMPPPTVYPQQYYHPNQPGQPGQFPDQHGQIHYNLGQNHPYSTVPQHMYGPGAQQFPPYPMQAYPPGYPPAPGSIEMTNVALTSDMHGDGKGTFASPPPMHTFPSPEYYGNTHVPISNAYPVTTSAPIAHAVVSYSHQ